MYSFVKITTVLLVNHLITRCINSDELRFDVNRIVVGEEMHVQRTKPNGGNNTHQ